MSWGVFVPWYGHLLGADHEAVSVAAMKYKASQGATIIAMCGEAISQHLTHLGSPSLPAGRSSSHCPARAVWHAAWWRFRVAESPELPLSSSPPPTAQKISWPFAKQCCVCLGEGSPGRGGQKGFV